MLLIIYLSFISLGLPDALLGSAWPVMHQALGVNVSYAGMVTILIAAGTVVSSLMSDRLTKWLGPGRVTAISVAMTAAALLGFSLSTRFWMLCLWAIPYGLGAGSVDAALNNYVALHYASRHMSWLHCMWGVGASVGPYIMGWALTGGRGWNAGYQAVAVLQILLTAVLVISIPKWKKAPGAAQEGGRAKPLPLGQILGIPGAREVLVAFFCYCALEQTAALWASSYFVLRDGLDPDTAASYASLFFLGITLGRLISGFVTYRMNDVNMIRLGQGITALGILTMLLPLGSAATMAGLLLIGLGCAPIYPCIIHSTPDHFGADNSQALIGVQMASAYIGICLAPPIFGLIAQYVSTGLLPVYLMGINILMILMCERLNKICS